MSAHQGLNWVQGIFGGGFCCVLIGFLLQRMEAAIVPTMVAQGMSQTMAALIDGLNVAANSMPIIGLILMGLALIIWLTGH